MEKDRLLAFSDGVIAIIITIMVLELKVPHDVSLEALASVTPVFLTYVLSFVYVSIYWNNHHHFFHIVRQVDGVMLWANLHLLFWLSLIPFATGWMGENHFAPLPTAVYGVALLMPAIGRDLKGKLSPAFYVAGILSAFFDARLASAIYVLVALMWLIPDRRIENAVRRPSAEE
jgi:Endosomal/lysosomal potassium channel TMEM175